jgi:hypothetical protein
LNGRLKDLFRDTDNNIGPSLNRLSFETFKTDVQSQYAYDDTAIRFRKGRIMQLAVIKKDGDWAVFQDGSMLEHGGTRSACIELAEMIAFEAEERGEPVELLIQDYLGEVKTRVTRGS